MPRRAVVFLFGALALAAALAPGCSRERSEPAQPPIDAIDAGIAGPLVKEVLAIEDPLTRLARLAPLFPRLSPEALPEVLAAYERSGLDGGDPELVLLGLWWARFDPRAAVAWTTRDWRAEYGAVLQAVYRSWAHENPEAALAAAQALHRPAQRDLCTDAAIAGWDESGRPGLEERVRAFAGIDQQRVAELLARRRVVSLGAEGALRWAESLEGANYRDMMLRRVASAAALGEPEVAARWAEPRIAAAARPTGLPRRIGTRWVRHDPEGAMTWLASLPAGKDRDDGVTESFRDWIVRDPAAATAWIERESMAPWNESAFYVYARAYSGPRPEEMLAVAARISEPSLREATQVYVLRVWLQSDREAAEAWLARSDLPEELRSRARMQRTLPPREELLEKARTEAAAEPAEDDGEN